MSQAWKASYMALVLNQTAGSWSCAITQKVERLEGLLPLARLAAHRDGVLSMYKRGGGLELCTVHISFL